MAKTVISITKETPMWAKWMFRISFVLCTVATFIIASDPGITDEVKVRANVYIQAFSMFVYGVSKLFGIKPEEEDEVRGI